VAALCFGDAGLALTRAGLYQAAAPWPTVPRRRRPSLPDRHEDSCWFASRPPLGEDDPALAPLVGNARRYVQQYRGAPDGQVWVSFDGPAIERWLTQNDQPLGS